MVIPHAVTISSLEKPNLLKILNSRNKMWKGGSKITKREEQWSCGKRFDKCLEHASHDRDSKTNWSDAENNACDHWSRRVQNPLLSLYIFVWNQSQLWGFWWFVDHRKTRFFVREKIRNSAGIVRGCLQGSWIDVGHLTRNIWRLSIKKLCS